MVYSRHWVRECYQNYHFRYIFILIIAIAVRSGGFYVVTISDLRQGLLVLYGKKISTIVQKKKKKKMTKAHSVSSAHDGLLLSPFLFYTNRPAR